MEIPCSEESLPQIEMIKTDKFAKIFDKITEEKDKKHYEDEV
jgi:hypothetical protein